ncbi:MAG: AAA family ATPase [Opitutaceae bacterium]
MIQAVTLTHFRGIADVRTFPLDPKVTLILGPNGAGKTSTGAAVEYALAGSCQWTDRGGKGAAVLVSNHTDKAAVELATDFGVISRTISAKGANLSAGDRTGKDAAAFLAGHLPQEAVLRAMLRTDGLTGLAPKEQQDLLFQVSGGAVDAEWFRANLTAEEGEILSDELTALVAGPALADKLYSAAYTLRTAANKRAKECQGRVQPAAATPALDADAEKQLAALRKKASTLREKIGAGKQSVRQQEAAAQRCEAAQAKVKQLREQIDALGAEPEAGDPDALPGLEEATAQAQRDLNAAKEALAAAKATEAGKREQLDKFRELAGACVIEGVECPLQAERRAEVEKTLAEAWMAAQVVRDDAGTAVNDGAEAVVAALAKLGEARTVVDAHRSWTETADTLERQVAEATAERDRLNGEYQQTGAPNMAALEEGLAKAEEQIGVLEQQQTAARQAELAAAQGQQAAKNLAQAEDRAALLDGLVRKLSPAGRPAQAMAATVGQVLAQINEVLKQMVDFVLMAQPGADFELAVDLGGDLPLLPVRCLSESEQLRVGVAVQVALAKVTGFGFVIVDEADRLDPEQRPKLLGMLLASGVQALVLATAANGHVPQAEGLTVYRLEKGVPA